MPRILTEGASGPTEPAPRHELKGLAPNALDNAYMATCSCGWWSALHASSDDARAAWREHVGRQGGHGVDPAAVAGREAPAA